MISNQHYRWLALLLVPAALLFFIGGPTAITLPSGRHAWNLGHIGFFFLLALALYGFKPAWFGRYLFRMLALIVVVSIAIEAIQSSLGRGFSFVDIGRNLSGFSLALILIYRRRVNKLIALAGIIFLVGDLAIFTRTALLDWVHQNQLAVIANFESAPLSRFAHGHFRLSSQEVYAGSASAMFQLQPARYAGLSLHPVPRNWRGYKTLSLAIFNAAGNPYTVTIRINDTIHELSTEQDYNDRYNHRFNIAPGWNDINIPLTDIINAPEARKMTLTRMHRIGIFISNLEHPLMLGLDEVKLTR